MKILAIGDLHGEFSQKWSKLIIKEKIDVVVCNGDYFPFIAGKLWFKYCFGTDIELWEIIGKKKYEEILKKEVRLGKKAIMELNDVKVPVLSVLGNHDEAKSNMASDVLDRPKRKGEFNEDFLTGIFKKCKNIKRIDYSFAKFGEFVFIGMRGGSNPGKVKSKAFKKSKQKLEKLFKKFKDKKIIFVAHNSPYNTKLDKIGLKAHEAVRGKHYGSKLSRRIIEKYQPILSLSGHIDEARGVDKIGKTICINSGPLHDGFAAIIDLNDKLKYRLIKI